MAEIPKPHVQRLLVEAMALLMGLDRGQVRLELVFVDGHLTQWWAHDEKNGPRELARFDGDSTGITWAAEALAGELLETAAARGRPT